MKPQLQSVAHHATYATDTIADPFADGEPPHTANRILNYRRIQNWEHYLLASAICSVAVATGADEETLKTLGRDKVNGGFHFYSALTGDMFTVLYATNKPCDSGVTNCFFLPQVAKKAYTAFGYDCVYLSNAQIKKDLRAAMNAIKASADRGIPALAWGMGNVTMGDGSRYDPLPDWLRWVGVPLGAVSFALYGWSQAALGSAWSPHLQTRGKHSLVTTGPYSRMRHPVYLALLGFLVAIALVSANWFFVALLLVSIVVVALRIPKEEQMMIEEFGDEYREYMQRTGGLLPK